MARSSSSLMPRRPATSRYGRDLGQSPNRFYISSQQSRTLRRPHERPRGRCDPPGRSPVARSSSETSAATSRPRRSRLSLTLCVAAASLLGLDVGYCVTFPQARVLMACECPGPFIKLLIRGRCDEAVKTMDLWEVIVAIPRASRRINHT